MKEYLVGNPKTRPKAAWNKFLTMSIQQHDLPDQCLHSLQDAFVFIISATCEPETITPDNINLTHDTEHLHDYRGTE